jgi:hypothetical protein
MQKWRLPAPDLRVMLAAVVVAAGCASSGQRDTDAAAPGVLVTSDFGEIVIERYVDAAGTHHRLSARPEAVWLAVMETFEELGIEVGTLDQGSRTIGNTRLMVTRTLAGEPLSRFLDCGARVLGPTMANTHRLELRILTRVLPDGAEGSRIRTELHGVARPVGTSTRPTDCVSRGALEDRIVQGVMGRIEGS